MKSTAGLTLAVSLIATGIVSGAGLATTRDVHTVSYPGSSTAGELQYPSRFHVWVPGNVARIRAVIVRQHGCGTGAEESGENGVFDLHWRALARKHDAALLSPHYIAGEKDCRQWCDPRNGSGQVFLKALNDLAASTGHPELATAPWCLWGHSGGAFWSSLMLASHPERIVAIWLRSGSSVQAWQKGEIPQPTYSAPAWSVPVAINPGLKERGDARFDGIWQTSSLTLAYLRANGAPVLFAPDPLSNHDCRNSRLLAIPYFDVCLKARLPRTGNALRSLRSDRQILVDGSTGEAVSSQTAATGVSSENLSWLPDGSLLRAFGEYIRTGLVTDTTAPSSAPHSLRASRVDSLNEWILEWEAEADFESGIREFVIYRDGTEAGRIPEKPDDRTGFSQFQGISYHDTPKPGFPRMRWIDYNQPAGKSPKYQVSAVNGAGLESPRSKPAGSSPR
ncbi:MAG: hypothetical protein FJ405_01235 [Verrucomicrobia bacterium]|nr:hypothetical protein [Verrucomicrobiota bacterium]